MGDVFKRRHGCGAIIGVREACSACTARDRDRLHAQGIASAESPAGWAYGLNHADARMASAKLWDDSCKEIDKLGFGLVWSAGTVAGESRVEARGKAGVCHVFTMGRKSDGGGRDMAVLLERCERLVFEAIRLEEAERAQARPHVSMVYPGSTVYLLDGRRAVVRKRDFTDQNRYFVDPELQESRWVKREEFFTEYQLYPVEGVKVPMPPRESMGVPGLYINVRAPDDGPRLGEIRRAPDRTFQCWDGLRWNTILFPGASR